MPGAGYNGRKPSSQKCRCCKLCTRNCIKSCRTCDIKFRLCCIPHCCMPLWSLLVVLIKMGIQWLCESTVVWVYLFYAIVSSLARLFRCGHFQDCLYSCMECDEILEECYNRHWEVTFWREHERTRQEETYVRKYSVEEDRANMKAPPVVVTQESVIEEV